jgi:hypothetical protein
MAILLAEVPGALRRNMPDPLPVVVLGRLVHAIDEQAVAGLLKALPVSVQAVQKQTVQNQTVQNQTDHAGDNPTQGPTGDAPGPK